MDARRFDGFSKAWSAGTSRRRLLQALPAVALGSLLPAAARADAGAELVLPAATTTTTTGAPGATTTVPVGAPGTTTTTIAVGAAGTTAAPTAVAGSAAPPVVSTQPEVDDPGIGAQISPTQVLPARIYAGVCGQLEAEAAFQLIDIGAAGAQGTATPASTTPVGAASAIPVRYSTTIVDALLDDLTASDFAIEIRIDADDPATAVVCGDIGGILGGQEPGTELAIGLAQANTSGFTGVAWLRDEGEQTVINLFIAAGLANGGVGSAAAPVVETPAATTTETAAAAAVAEIDSAETETDPDSAFAAGAMVLTSAEVNLRAAPSLDAAIIAILGPGIELEVTGGATDGWVPVLEVGTGRRGFVTDAFLTAQ